MPPKRRRGEIPMGGRKLGRSIFFHQRVCTRAAKRIAVACGKEGILSKKNPKNPIRSCSALLLWAVFSIPKKGCALDEDTEGTAKHKTRCRDVGVTMEKLVLLKVRGLAAAERDFFL